MVRLPREAKIYGDLVPGHDLCGPIEQTIEKIPAEGLLICGETIEHLDDPGAFLTVARARVASLVISTPVGSWDDPTPGHYWAWDREEVELMLRDAGFTPETYLEMSWPGLQRLPHAFGIWSCR
jgi:hypothetical protein